MRTIVHLSDLHFGQVNEETLKPLQQTIKKIAPHLVIISGDLTHKAKPEEYLQARKFIQGLPRPRLVVPGNHDIPVYNILARILKPREVFKKYIRDNLQPTYKDEELFVIGLNTTTIFQIKNGRVGRGQLRLAQDFFSQAPEEAIKIVVTHHPFVSSDRIQRAVVGAKRTVKKLEKAKPDLFLSGHLHVNHTAHSGEKFRTNNYSSLLIQAGTATSTRHRNSANSFNVLEVSKQDVLLKRYFWNEPEKNFILAQNESFLGSESGWKKA